MSLYHEAAAVLTESASQGGSLKSRIYGNRELKSPPAQIYALALETCKWSPVLKEVVEASGILQMERKLTPILSLLLVHDFLLSKSGIALPPSHGLRASVERHRARLSAEFTRARLRRKASSLDALRLQVEAASRTGPVHPRWVRINTLRTTVREQLDTTLSGFGRVSSVEEIVNGAERAIYVDENVPDLVGLSPGATDLTKTDAYRSGAIILQDKASCFPAYLLNPSPADGDVIDSCAAPGNKTTQLAALLRSHGPDHGSILAFEKDKNRAKTLLQMVKLAGADSFVRVHPGTDFLKVDPASGAYQHVGALLLDPSCSGSGIVGRDEMPDLHLPDARGGSKAAAAATKTKRTKKKGPASAAQPPPPQEPDSRKRKRTEDDDGRSDAKPMLVDDDGAPVAVASEKDLVARVDALAAFQLSLVTHAFRFPAARRVTYSTCSVYERENEQVVREALASAVARERGWRILRRDEQVDGLRRWPVRGVVEACGGDAELADACIRTYKDDGRGVMGFFVAAFVRDA